MLPLTRTDNLAMSVALASETSPTRGWTMSFHSMADRLLREDDNVLSEALNNAARNKPGMPGKEENKSKTVSGMI